MTERPILKSFDRVADRYDATRGFPTQAEAAIAAGLRALLPGQAPRLLEVGIGSGRVAAPLAATGVRVTGIDISPKMLALLRSRAPEVDALFAEAAHLPFRDGAFDAALFVHILHLVPDARGTVREAARVAGAGGVLLACETRHDANPIAEAGQHIREVTADVIGAPLVPRGRFEGRHTTAFREVAAELGATIQEHALARWDEIETARELLEGTLTQLHSHSWSIPAGKLPEIVERSTPGVVAITGGLDVEVVSQATFRVVVARL